MAEASFHTVEAPRGMHLAGLTAPLRNCVVLLRHATDRQRTRHALLDLDDHLLNDIGKSRQEALEEAHKPFWR